MDLTGARWRKSSFTGSNGGTCVEVADVLRAGPARLVAVRDSKDPEGPVLSFPGAAWHSFVSGIKSGDFRLA